MKPTLVKRLSALPVKNGLGLSGAESDRSDPRYIRITDINQDGQLREDIYASQPRSVIEDAWVESGDVLIASVGATVGKSYLHRADGEYCFAGYLSRIRPDREKLDPRFLHYWTQSNNYWDQVRTRLVSSTIENLSASKIGTFQVPTPPLPLQSKIADYLDHETSEIDAFIADQERLAILSHECEWSRLSSLLEYPEKFSDLWSGASSGLVSLKHLGAITLGKMLDSGQPSAREPLHAYLRAANVQPMGRLELGDVKKMRFTEKERARLNLRAGDVVLVEGGVGGYGRAAFLKEDLPDIGFQNSILRFRPRQNVDGRFVAYALLLLRKMGYIEAVASVSSMPHFTAEKVAETPIPITGFSEQRRIANELDSVWSSAAKLDEDLREAVDLARERRAALVTAAVTGHIDVTQRRRPVAEQLEEEVLQDA